MSVLHVAEVDGRLVFRTADRHRYTVVRLDERGAVIGWSRDASAARDGARLVPCRVATADDLVAYRAQQRALASSLLVRKLDKVRQFIALSRRRVIELEHALLAETFGDYYGQLLGMSRFPGRVPARAGDVVTVELLNETSALKRETLEFELANIPRLEREAAALEGTIAAKAARAAKRAAKAGG